MDTLTTMRTFAAVARHQSFTTGARECGLSTKVASNQVRALEARLGVQLLHRTTRRVTLTATGAAYLDKCVPLLEEVDELESLVQARHAELAGVIRISAPTAFGGAELIEALAPFQAEHPRVEIDLQLADHRVNIVEDGFDLALRFGELEDSTLMARKLLDMPIVMYASPEYLERHGTPQKPQDLSSHNCILQQTARNPATWLFQENGTPVRVRVNGTARTNSPRAVAHLAAAGGGIGMTPRYVADGFLHSGALVRLLEGYEASALPLHAVYPGTRQLVSRVRVLIDYLVGVWGEEVVSVDA